MSQPCYIRKLKTRDPGVYEYCKGKYPYFLLIITWREPNPQAQSAIQSISEKFSGHVQNLYALALPSNSGKNFKDLHIHIMNIKAWLRGIHHHCSKARMQNYLDEYHFRYNRRSNMDTIFNLLLKRMVNYSKYPDLIVAT